jgi:ubiquinone/menaquinone biosynthesis C-methylase UbiE
MAATPGRSNSTAGSSVERVRAIYDRRAPGYHRRARFMERLFWGERRSRVCSLAAGDVLEIALGTGLNLPFYGRNVWLTGVELSPAMRDLAIARAKQLGIVADLRLGDAQALEFPDESFDAVVCTQALCTIPSDLPALREARRVLRPAGKLLLAEHVQSPRPIVRFVERLLEPAFVRSMGDHLLRDQLDHLEELGFKLGRVDRVEWGILEWVVATKP